MNLNTIDLNQAEKAVASFTTDDNEQKYQPKTLDLHNEARRNYLPLYPTKAFSRNNHLLLANVSITHLGPSEIARRQYGADTVDAITLMNNYNYSDHDGFSLSEQDAEELSKRLQIGKSIITFNATQIRSICYYFRELYKLFRQNVLLQQDGALEDYTTNSKQVAILLEFYLQIDVDIFYMKTCSFRGAKPQSIMESLFCGEDEPHARYTMSPCVNPFCSCCHNSSATGNGAQHQLGPVVDFSTSSMHQFLNGYTTYLNCPATCRTSNVIYTMTCPCGYYDYVDSTAKTLIDAVVHHRKHGNRVIHEMLTGNCRSSRTLFDLNESENEVANKMRLYQHSARCPIALRLFLDYNPNYWCFIPMLKYRARAKNIAYVRQARGSSSSSFHETIGAQMSDLTATSLIGRNSRVIPDLHDVPRPPSTIYEFSYEQRQKQRLFFEELLSSSTDQLSYSPVNLYKVAIIVVLPDDCSITLRYIIETLFIIHGETKLNMICPIGGDSEQRYGRPYGPVWCLNLNRSSICTTIRTRRTTATKR
ncbi:unnamed protein product [Adineta steineri]|uniref:Uncharacterized protein n=1 Tax=Adineta steineri TaxID=433720 RepID=A0A818RBR2_9BILA|nr:unnamed protein product [Adineta steineri]CAF3650345.1 unnamed protein product [Adineta steineri]